MNSRQLLLRAVRIAIALALITGAFFNLTSATNPKRFSALSTPGRYAASDSVASAKQGT